MNRFIISVLAACLLWSSAAATESKATAHFIDVGKGDASLMEFPCGAILVDAGGGEGSAAALVEYLDRFFAMRPDLNRHLDVVVLTHGHLDHTRNIAAVLDTATVGTLVVNGHFKKRGYKGLRKLLRRIPETEIFIADAEDIPDGGLWHPSVDPLDCDGQRGGSYPDIRLIWGDARPQLPGWSDKFYKDENNHSVSLVVSWGAHRTLFTGDLEKQGLKELMARHSELIKDVDLYQISHHGFRSGTTAGFLEHINPMHAILSRPADRAWHAPTMARFDRLVRGRRAPVTVPVWEFAQGGIAEVDADRPDSMEDATPGKRPRTESTAEMSGAIYWTGRDGSIRITFGAEREPDLQTGPLPAR